MGGETQGVMGEGGAFVPILQMVVDPVLPHGHSDTQRTVLLLQTPTPE